MGKQPAPTLSDLQEWRKTMIGILGSEEAFNYQYSIQFAASDKCILSREALAKIKQSEELFDILKDESYYNLHKQCFYIKSNYSISNFKNKHYVILVDLAEGGGGDYTIFKVLPSVTTKI